MFTINNIDQLDPLDIYLVKPTGDIIQCISSELDEDKSNLHVGLNRQFELSVEVSESDNSNQWFDLLQEGMYLYVENIGLFRMSQPQISCSGDKQTKIISAKSCDCELEDKTCQFSINTGTKDSLEYNVVYDTTKYDELIVDPYTNIPYDWIVLYNTYPEQLEKISYNDNDIINDLEKIRDIKNLLDKIPRLRRKVIETTTTDENGLESTNYAIKEYVTYTYDENNENIVSIKFEVGFADRLKELINFYTENRDQLSLLSIVLEKTGGAWSVGEVYGVAGDDYSLADKRFSFEINENIYSFFTQTFAQSSNCIVEFDITNRRVNVTPIEKIGKNTGIVLSYSNLMNSLGISESNESVCTRLYVNGADDINIEQVNFGLPYIEDLSYKMNAKDSDGNYLYVSKSLHDKYEIYAEDVEVNRKEYVKKSKIYNNKIQEIDELTYRVPLDDLKTDWGAFSKEELIEHKNNYNNLLNSLKTLYREDYHILDVSAEINEDHIKSTPYWYDYIAYKNIIDEIECAIDVFPYYADNSKWTSAQINEYKDKIKAWETDWSLYGSRELESKISSYEQNMKILTDSVEIYDSGENVGKAKKWNDLTVEEKSKYNNLEETYESNAEIYEDYRENCVSAKSYLELIKSQLKKLESEKKAVQDDRILLASESSLSGWKHEFDDKTTISFIDYEIKTINLLIRESTYQNNNIVITSINTPDEKLDILEELYQDGKEKISIYSRPQLSFSVDADNILGLTEYEPMWNDFAYGNYITVQYFDDTYLELRLVGYTFNPSLPSSSNLSIEFSNYILSKSKISDLESLLGTTSSTSGSSRSSSGSNNSGEFGTSDDINVLISNTMLSKLLNSETFGTRVTDVILDTMKLNVLNATYARFSDLSVGNTTIDGSCIKTGLIKSKNYNGTEEKLIENTEGSVIELDNGYFNFGGCLKWDGSKFSIGTGLEWDDKNDLLSVNGTFSTKDNSGERMVKIEDGKQIFGIIDLNIVEPIAEIRPYKLRSPVPHIDVNEDDSALIKAIKKVFNFVYNVYSSKYFYGLFGDEDNSAGVSIGYEHGTKITIFNKNIVDESSNDISLRNYLGDISVDGGLVFSDKSYSLGCLYKESPNEEMPMFGKVIRLIGLSDEGHVVLADGDDVVDTKYLTGINENIQNQIDNLKTNVSGHQTNIDSLYLKAVQQGGKAYKAPHKIHLDWDDSNLQLQVDDTSLGAVAMRGEVTMRGDIVTTRDTIFSGVTIEPGKNYSVNYTVEKAGYKPLGIVGYNTDGNWATFASIPELYLSSQSKTGSAIVKANIRNIEASHNITSFTLEVCILWVKA